MKYWIPGFRFRFRHSTSVLVLGTLAATVMWVLVSRSDAYEEARCFSLGDPKLVGCTGKIRKIEAHKLSGWRLNDSVDSGSAQFTFDIEAANGNYVVDD